MNNKENGLEQNSNHPWINNTLRQDMIALLEWLNSDQKMATNKLESITGIPQKVISEILAGKQLISDVTIYRFYRYFFSEVSSEHLGIRHEWIKVKFLNDKKIFGLDLQKNIEEHLENCAFSRKIYLNSRLHSINKKELLNNLSPNELNSLEILLANGLIKECPKNENFVIGEKSISKNPKLLKKLVLDLIKMGVTEENLWGLDQNSCFYGMEMVNEETYKKIINIVDQSKKEIINLLKENNCAGDIPLFVVSAVDKLENSLREQ